MESRLDLPVLAEIDGHAQWARVLPSLVTPLLQSDSSCPEETKSYLHSLLCHDDPFLPRRLLQGLGETGHALPVTAFQILSLYLSRSEDYLHEDALRACTSILRRTNGELRGVLLDWAESDDVVLRRAAARCVSTLSPTAEGLRGELIGALASDRHHAVRREIARGLKYVPPIPLDQAVPLLTELAGDARLCIRRTALASALSLGQRFPHKVVPPLRAMLGYLVAGLREAFIENLMNHMNAFLPLTLEVLAGLEKLSLSIPEEVLGLLTLVSEEKDWIHPKLLSRCAQITSKIAAEYRVHTEEARKILRPLERDEDPEVQRTVRLALGDNGKGGASESLRASCRVDRRSSL